MEQTFGEQATLCPSYGENLEFANNGDQSQYEAISTHTHAHTLERPCLFSSVPFITQPLLLFLPQ